MICLRTVTGVSRYTARKYIKRAVDCRLILEKPDGSRKRYSVSLDQLDKASKLLDVVEGAVGRPKLLQ